MRCSSRAFGLHRTPEVEEDNAIHDDPFVDQEFIIREETCWVNHKMEEESFDTKLVSVAKQEELNDNEEENVIKRQSGLEPSGL